MAAQWAEMMVDKKAKNWAAKLVPLMAESMAVM